MSLTGTSIIKSGFKVQEMPSELALMPAETHGQFRIKQTTFSRWKAAFGNYKVSRPLTSAVVQMALLGQQALQVPKTSSSLDSISNA